jgi:hypothetical protein
VTISVRGDTIGIITHIGKILVLNIRSHPTTLHEIDLNLLPTPMPSLKHSNLAMFLPLGQDEIFVTYSDSSSQADFRIGTSVQQLRVQEHRNGSYIDYLFEFSTTKGVIGQKRPSLHGTLLMWRLIQDNNSSADFPAHLDESNEKKRLTFVCFHTLERSFSYKNFDLPRPIKNGLSLNCSNPVFWEDQMLIPMDLGTLPSPADIDTNHSLLIALKSSSCTPPHQRTTSTVGQNCAEYPEVVSNGRPDDETDVVWRWSFGPELSNYARNLSTKTSDLSMLQYEVTNVFCDDHFVVLCGRAAWLTVWWFGDNYEV